MSLVYKEVWGDEGEAIVMLHGWAMHSGLWRNFAQQLAKTHQVHCLDLCGHGRSENIEPYSLELILELLVAELPQQPCTLIGWSLGGNIALAMAKKYPQRIKAVILIASNPHFLKTADWQGVESQVLDVFKANLLENPQVTLWRFMSLQVQAMAQLKFELNKLREVMRECPVPSVNTLEKALALLITTDSRYALQTLKMPSQLILGEVDSLIPIGAGEQCVQLQPNLELNIIQGAGHAPFLSHESQLLSIMHDFMARRAA